MALLGAPKGWVVSGELSAFTRTFFFYLKVKWREVRIPAFAERDGRPVALGYSTGSLVVSSVGRTPQCVLSLDFWTGKARMWAWPGPSFGPW